MEQSWLIPYPLSFDGNKLFKEQLGILTFIQVWRIIRLRTYEEKLEDSESKVQTLALKITYEDSGSDGRSRLWKSQLWRKSASSDLDSEAS